MCVLEGECACRAAVIRAYHELRSKRVRDEAAFHSAARVYRFYHPEVSPLDARFAVAEWIEESQTA